MGQSCQRRISCRTLLLARPGSLVELSTGTKERCWPRCVTLDHVSSGGGQVYQRLSRRLPLPKLWGRVIGAPTDYPPFPGLGNAAELSLYHQMPGFPLVFSKEPNLWGLPGSYI